MTKTIYAEIDKEPFTLEVKFRPKVDDSFVDFSNYRILAANSDESGEDLDLKCDINLAAVEDIVEKFIEQKYNQLADEVLTAEFFD